MENNTGDQWHPPHGPTTQMWWDDLCRRLNTAASACDTGTSAFVAARAEATREEGLQADREHCDEETKCDCGEADFAIVQRGGGKVLRCRGCGKHYRARVLEPKAPSEGVDAAMGDAATRAAASAFGEFLARMLIRGPRAR